MFGRAISVFVVGVIFSLLVKFGIESFFNNGEPLTTNQGIRVVIVVALAFMVCCEVMAARRR